MKELRLYVGLIAVVLVALVGVWLAAPRDVCLTKLVSNSGCVCVAETNTSSDCNCCASQSEEQDQGSTKHGPGCFSISSQDIQLINPERAHDAVAMDLAVAVIPIVELLIESGLKPGNSIQFTEFSSSGRTLYRDNCVFLI